MTNMRKTLQLLSARFPTLSMVLRGHLGFGKPCVLAVLASALWVLGFRNTAYELYDRVHQPAGANSKLKWFHAELTRRLFVESLKETIGAENGNYLRTELALKVQENPELAFQSWRASPPGRALARNNRDWCAINSHRPKNPENILICSHRNWNFTLPVVRGFEDWGLKVDTLRGESIPQPVAMSSSNLFLPQNNPIQEAEVNFLWLKNVCPEIASKIENSDVIFVDWANEAALWMARMVPPDKRLVIRLHSYEAFSPWVHFIPWARIDALICVGEHIRAFMDEQFGLSESIPNLEQYVIPNWTDPNKWTTDKEANARHRLIMIGYASSSKGPIAAINVLEELFRLAPDTAWELRFVGHNWPKEGLTKEEERCRDLFLNKIENCGLKGAISQCEYTTEIGQHLMRAGFILSASERESQHMTIVEGAMSGCIPVVRRWPVGERWSGAARLYPNALLWDHPRQAAEKIISLSEAKSWEKTRADARHDAATRFSPEAILPDLYSAVRGP